MQASLFSTICTNLVHCVLLDGTLLGRFAPPPVATSTITEVPPNSEGEMKTMKMSYKKKSTRSTVATLREGSCMLTRKTWHTHKPMKSCKIHAYEACRAITHQMLTKKAMTVAITSDLLLHRQHSIKKQFHAEDGLHPSCSIVLQ